MIGNSVIIIAVVYCLFGIGTAAFMAAEWLRTN